jgi:hypothetical protein
MMRIYLASSWRNCFQQLVVRALRSEGFEVYDFKNPEGIESNNHGFHWSEIDPRYEKWSTSEFRMALGSKIARDGFLHDVNAMKACDHCLLLLPCGKPAHMEFGWFAGRGVPITIMAPAWTKPDPELMYLLADESPFNLICTNYAEASTRLHQFKNREVMK